MIGKNNSPNPFVLMQFIENVLKLMNPIVPNFAENTWSTIVRPALLRCTNINEPKETLVDQGWPDVSGPVDPEVTAILDYLTGVKREIRLSQQKANKQGGKGGKKGKGKQPAEETKAPETCTLFVGLEFPEYKKRVLTCLSTEVEFDENNKPIGKWQTKVQAAMQGLDKKVSGLAMKFGAFVLEQVENVGKEAALRDTLPFDEVKML